VIYSYNIKMVFEILRSDHVILKLHEILKAICLMLKLHCVSYEKNWMVAFDTKCVVRI